MLKDLTDLDGSHVCFILGVLPWPLTFHVAFFACRQCGGVSPCDRDSSHPDAAAGEDKILSSLAG